MRSVTCGRGRTPTSWSDWSAAPRAWRASAVAPAPRLIPIGTAAMNDVEAACKEAERCPIWIHPYFNPSRPDPEIDLPGLNIAQVFGWPFDTVIAMTCLIYGGVLDRFPNLKFITHHAGASIPFFEQRMATHPG
jgi:amidohydrolase family protein